MNVATVLSNGKCTDMEVQGRDLIAGRPTTIKVTSADARAALREPVYSIIGTIRGVLENARRSFRQILSIRAWCLPAAARWLTDWHSC